MSSSGNKLSAKASAAESKPEEQCTNSPFIESKDVTEEVVPPPEPVGAPEQATAPRRSPRDLKRKSTTTTPGNTARKSPKTPSKTTMQSVATADTEDLRFFDANEWAIFGEAHQMMETLVKSDCPYRKKLLDLAQHSINNWKGPEEYTSAGVVDSAWNSVCYFWADPSSDENLDGECAYSSIGKGNDGKPNFPIIAISSSFKENDYEQRDRQAALMMDDKKTLTTDDKKALLLFFRKIKHEFLHVVHRYLGIRYKKKFPMVGTPEKYTPSKQNSRRKKPDPQVGDHDEEEDSGGPILPLMFNQKLSTTNPLCLYFDDGYLPLEDEIVEGLLKLELYSVAVKDRPHVGMYFGIDDCRAVKEGVFDEDFYLGNPTANGYRPGSSVRAVSSKSSSASSSRACSPANGYETDETDDNTGLAAWRRNGHIAKQIPDSFFLKKVALLDKMES